MVQTVLTPEKTLLVGSFRPADGAAALAAARGADPRLPALEVRLDGLAGPIDLAALRAALPGRTLIATLRSRDEGGAFDGGPGPLREKLAAALDAAFDLVDVEHRLAGGSLLGLPPDRVVVSHHRLDGVPDDLPGLVGEMRQSGARLVKVVGTPRSFGDALALLEAQRREADGRVALFGMGELGLVTRALSPWLGASLAYGALDPAAPTAPGQLSAADLLEVYGVGSSRRAERVFALLGSRVSHSFSPALHNGLFAALGLPAVYVPAALVSFRKDFEALLAFLDDAGAPLGGASVTVPFKGAAAALHPCNGEAAVNTLVRDADGFRTFNTDRLALLAAIRPARSGERALLLGAGGMAESAAQVLSLRGYAIEVLARRAEAASSFAARHGGEVAGGAGPYAVVVNATPLGLSASDPLPCDAALLGAGTLVVDSPYRPGGTLLVREARARGAAAVDGFSLLVGQAVQQSSLFTGREVTAAHLKASLPARLRGLFEPTGDGTR